MMKSATKLVTMPSMKSTGLALVLASTLALAVACGRDESKSPAADSATTDSATSGEAGPTGDAGSAAPAAEGTATEAAPAEGSPMADAATPPAEDPEALARKQAVEFALAEQKIADDPKGQWAATAEASSSFGDAKDQGSYSAWQVTGAPNVERYSDDGNSWASKDADKGIEWIEVGFAKPVHAEMLRIRQNNAPGAIIKVELIDAAGARQTVFEGIDSTTYPANTISWFAPPFEKTANPIAKARITLATNSIPGWNEIDAVQLVGE